MIPRLFRYGPARLFSASPRHETVYLALGSNLGDRASKIHQAINKLTNFSKVVQTSFLYESAPMYVTDQPSFLNAVIQIETSLAPLQLLRSLKDIEVSLGRNVLSPRNSPRPIDLDILTYGQHIISDSSNGLHIPHMRLFERDFVLRPLHDIDPNILIPQQSDNRALPVSHLLSSLLSSTASSLKRVTPLPNGHVLRWGTGTHLMGVINATPDSFSDGGKHESIDAALNQVERFASFGFNIIDLGGQSTRPGATLVDPEMELSRIRPVAEAIRRCFPDIIISVDTFHASVASSMLSLGACIVNDVSGGKYDDQMINVLRSTRAGGILMHMRGTPSNMQTLTDYDEDVSNHVAHELKSRLHDGMKNGVYRWQLIGDIGIGFAKTKSQNITLLRDLNRIRILAGGFPMMVGVSRKSFLKDIAREKSRDWATAGIIGAMVRDGGVDIIRVHREEIGDVVKAVEMLNDYSLSSSF